MNNTTIELPSLYKFWKMLRNHDWTFDYSDDSSVWRRGQQQLNAIREVVEAGGEEYRELFEEYSKYAWRKDSSINEPKRPIKTKEEQAKDREELSNLSNKLKEIVEDVFQLEEQDITSADQLWALLYPSQSIIHQIKNIVEDKSKSSSWNTVTFRGYRRIKEELDKI